MRRTLPTEAAIPSRRALWRALLALLALLAADPVTAQVRPMPPNYLQQFPDPERVLALFASEPDSMRRTALQAAAFESITSMIQNLQHARLDQDRAAGRRSEFQLPQEYELSVRYGTAAMRARPSFDAEATRREQEASAQYQWFEQKGSYWIDHHFHSYLLTNLFPEPFAKGYKAIDREDDVRPRLPTAATQAASNAQRYLLLVWYWPKATLIMLLAGLVTLSIGQRRLKATLSFPSGQISVRGDVMYADPALARKHRRRHFWARRLIDIGAIITILWVLALTEAIYWSVTNAPNGWLNIFPFM